MRLGGPWLSTSDHPYSGMGVRSPASTPAKVTIPHRRYPGATSLRARNHSLSSSTIQTHLIRQSLSASTCTGWFTTSHRKQPRLVREGRLLHEPQQGQTIFENSPGEDRARQSAAIATSSSFMLSTRHST